MARYCFNVGAARSLPSQTAGIRVAPHVTFGESYEQAARRELKEETGVSAPLRCDGKFSYHVQPENEVVAGFFCESDDAIRIDQVESSEASFHAKDEVKVIVASEAAALWLTMGWKIFADSAISSK